MQDKQEILKSFLTLLDKTVSKEEYLVFSKTLMDFVVKIEKNNSKEMDLQWQKIKEAVSEMEGKEESDFQKLKGDLTKTVKDQVSDMYANWAKMSDQIQERISELKDGEDADESKVCDMVMERMVQMPKEEVEDETAEETRDKLESLIGDERLDKSAIKGIDEALAQIASTGKATFVSGTAKPIRLTNDGTLIDKNIRNLNFKGTAVTSIVRNADGTIDITLDTGAGSTTPVNNEIVSGSGTTFTLAYTPTAGSVHLYGYGQRLTLTEDYTITGAVITTINSFDTGKILADYTK
jgi:hypothetical protein